MANIHKSWLAEAFRSADKHVQEWNNGLKESYESLFRTPKETMGQEVKSASSRTMTQEEAEAIARQHVELALSVVRWFRIDRRHEVTWGPSYNQAARDIYVRACALAKVPPVPAE